MWTFIYLLLAVSLFWLLPAEFSSFLLQFPSWNPLESHRYLLEPFVNCFSAFGCLIILFWGLVWRPACKLGYFLIFLLISLFTILFAVDEAHQSLLPVVFSHQEYEITGIIQRIKQQQNQSTAKQTRSKSFGIRKNNKGLPPKIGSLVIELQSVKEMDDNSTRELRQTVSQWLMFGAKKKVKLAIYQTAAIEHSINDFKVGQLIGAKVHLKRPRNSVNPVGFDAIRYAISHRIAAYGYIKQIQQKEFKEQTAGISIFFKSVKASAQQWVLQKQNRLSTTGVIYALLFGDKSFLSYEQKQQFRTTGTAHLTAISGLHIGIAAAYGIMLVRLSCFLIPSLMLLVPRQKLYALFGLLFAIFYASLSDFSLPTQRALTMLAFAVLFSLLNRKISSSQVLKLSAFVIVCLDPKAVIDSSFWFSFCAVAAILLFVSARHSTKKVDPDTNHLVKNKTFRLKYLISQFISLQICLFFCTWIILSLAGSLLHPISVLANLFVVPIFSLIVIPLCLFSLTLFFISPTLASFFLGLTDGFISITTNVLLFAESCINQTPNLYVNMPEGWFSALTLIGLLILLFSHASLPFKKLALTVLSLILIFLYKPANSTLIASENGELSVIFFDVGQGLSVLISTKSDHLLYDTAASSPNGWSVFKSIIQPNLHNLGVYKIDTLIVSHFDNDHAGGLIPAVETFPIRQILSPDPDQTSQIVDSHGTSSKTDVLSCKQAHTWVQGGFEMTSFSASEVTLNRNDQSCMLIVSTYKDEQSDSTLPDSKALVFLTGDISKRIEKKLSEPSHPFHQLIADADVISIPHHGSNTSSSHRFISQLSAENAVASAGFKNRYKHPDQRVLNRYQMHKIRTFNTAEKGAIIFKFKMHSEKKMTTKCSRSSQLRFWQDAVPQCE